MKQEELPPHVQRAIERAQGAEIVEIARRSLIREAEARIDAGPITGGVKRIIPSPNHNHPPFARGRAAKPSGMNKLEAAYGETLLARKAAGEILGYEYEGMTLKLGPDCRYTPDWMVLDSEGFVSFIECKGPFKRDDGMAKLRMAAGKYPWFRFVLVTRADDGAWTEKEVAP